MGLPIGVNLGGGAMDTVVPGQTPGTTPPFVASPGQQQGDPTQQINAQAQKILQAIAQASQRKQVSNTAVPGALPEGGDAAAARNIGMNTANPNAWSLQRFAAGVSANVKNAVRKQKEEQLLKAEGDWTYLSSSLNELYQAQQSGDQAAAAAAQKKIDVITQDHKKLKNMAKALNQDWLNPEKTTVYGEALKNVTAKTQQTEQQKSQAKQGLMGIFKQLMQKRQQPQLTPEQRQAMGREIQNLAPTSGGAQSMADLEKQASAVEDLARAQKELRATPEKYETKAIADPADPEGKRQILVAVDKTNPRSPYIEIKSESGATAEKAGKQYANEGKLEVIRGLPTGRVMHGGVYVAPGEKGYTAKDQEAVGLGLKAYNLTEEDMKKLAAVRGSSYAQERARYSVVPTVDNETGESSYASPLEILRNPGRYVQPGEAEKISARESAHKSINTNFDALDKDLDKLPNGLDTETQATLLAAFKSENDNPGIINTLIVNKVKQHAPDEVIRYLTDMKAMQEDILVLRNVGGMGQGSDLMRQKMIHLIPGPASSSVREAKMQMSAARRTSDSLFKGRPTARFTGGTGGGEGGGGGKVIVVTPEDMK